LLLDHVNNVITAVRDLQLTFAARNKMPCVDLGTLLASTSMPQLPDARFFLDNCHITDEAIERVMGAVADAVAGPPAPGPTGQQPVSGAPVAARAVAHCLAAAYCAYRGQPADVVRVQLDTALKTDRQAATEFLNA